MASEHVTKEVVPINWETGIFDIIDEIAKNLNIKDLCSMSKVSKSWHVAAEREKSKRFFMEQVQLNLMLDTITKNLKVQPDAALFIFDSNSDLKPRTLVRDYIKEEWPRKVTALKVNRYLVSSNVETKRIHKANWTATLDFHGMFFPSMDGRARVKMIWESSEVLTKGFVKRVEHLTRELDLQRKERATSALLLFTFSRDGHELANALIQNRENKDCEAIWVGMFQEVPAITVKNDSFVGHRTLMALKISGPSVNAWSVKFDSRVSRDELEQRLLDLKKKVTLRRYFFGIYYSPASNAYGGPEQIMENFKRIFPEIPLVGLYQNKVMSGADIFFEAPNDKYYVDMNFLSFIIISYN